MTSPIICTINRLYSSASGTFGLFEARELIFACYSLELPDRGNKPMRSCILEGTYNASWQFSKRFKKNMYRLENKHGRVGILIHSTNFAGDIDNGLECQLSNYISLGRERVKMPNKFGADQDAINESRATIAAFETAAEKRDLIIYINDPIPPGQPPNLCNEE